MFDAVYWHKSKIKSAEWLVTRTGFTRKKVLDLGHALAGHAFNQVKVKGRVAYEQDDWVQRNKDEILRYASDPKKLARLPTKTNPRPQTGRATVAIPRIAAPPKNRVKTITVDAIDSFALVRRRTGAHDEIKMPEVQFKRGIARILAEKLVQPDWGGEKGDLYTTNLRIDGKRVPAAFAFKGPGTRGILTPLRMGKNGDQIANLFEADAQVFLVQYWNGIAPSMATHLNVFSAYKASARNTTIWYGVIDGTDSARLIKAYPKAFGPVRKAR